MALGRTIPLTPAGITSGSSSHSSQSPEIPFTLLDSFSSIGEDPVNSIICKVHIVYINPTANAAKGSTARERAKNEVLHHGHNSLHCQLCAIDHRGFSVTGLKKILNRRQSPLLREEKACQKTPGGEDVAEISTRDSSCDPSREARAGDPPVTPARCAGIAPLGAENTRVTPASLPFTALTQPAKQHALWAVIYSIYGPPSTQPFLSTRDQFWTHNKRQQWF